MESGSHRQLRGAAADFLSAIRTEHSGSRDTQRTYRATLAALTEAAGEGADVADFGKDLAERTMTRWDSSAPATWNTHLSILRSFAEWLRDMEYLPFDADPCRRLRWRKVPDRLDTTRTEADIDALIADGRHALRERVLWSMAYATAARVSELLWLDVADLDFAQRRGRIRAKGGHEQLVFWDTRTARLLPRLLEGRAAGPVFLTDRRAPATGPRVPAPGDLCPVTGRARLSYRQAENLLKKASAPLDTLGDGWTFHDFRRSYLQHAADRGRSTHELQSKSRHKHLQTLAKYIRPNPAVAARMTAEDDPARRR